MSFAASNRVIMDAVHGLTEVDPKFWSVVDTPEVQRLRRIRQTGLAYLVYPGAEHSRFAHAIGSYSVARRVFHQLVRESKHTGKLSPSQLDGDLELAFTIGALCHDLGHTAFSHVLETLLLPEGFTSHEDCTLALLEDGRVSQEAKKLCDLHQVLQLLAGDHWNDGLCKLLSGQIDVDRWDYVMRDGAAAGLIYGNYDLDWLIYSLSLHPDGERKPRLLIEAHRGLVALEHFFSARRSMYRQVYYHTTVRGAERLLRAVFERASDPERPARYKKDTINGVPDSLHSVLSNKKPTLGEFIETDDTVIMAALKKWSKDSVDPVLKFLAASLVGRRLFKEVRYGGLEVKKAHRSTRSAVSRALQRQAGSLPKIDKQDRQALDYFVLLDKCTFKTIGPLDGILFDRGSTGPETFEDLQRNPDYEMPTIKQTFGPTRMFVPPEVLGSVKSTLAQLEKQ